MSHGKNVWFGEIIWVLVLRDSSIVCELGGYLNSLSLGFLINNMETLGLPLSLKVLSRDFSVRAQESM